MGFDVPLGSRSEMMTNRDNILEQFAASLPDQGEVFGVGPMELQARAVLQYVVGVTCSDNSEVSPSPLESDPLSCPNCDDRFLGHRSPYCGEACREMAGFVRQFRAGIDLQWIFEPEKQVALGQVLWHVLGGGRPLRVQIAPTRSRETALKRENGICQGCGATATTVDHIGSGCNRPINLRAVCDQCCLDRAFGDPTITNQELFGRTLAELAARIRSPIPLKCCDDADRWDWREYLRRRLNALESS